jgi:L-amino acid N-acyltransferase YncA
MHNCGVIRAAQSGDAAAIQSIYAHYVRETAVSFEIDPPTVEAMEARVATSLAWLVFVDGETVIGYAYAGPFHPRPAYRWSVEVSIYVTPHRRRSGVGRSLLEALLEDLAARGYVNAFAGVTLPNPASVGLFESFGFEPIAMQKHVGFKLGSWHDVGWWQKVLRPPSVPPPEIHP